MSSGQETTATSFGSMDLNNSSILSRSPATPPSKTGWGVGINIISFFVDEWKGLYPFYWTKKVFERTVDFLYWDEHYAWI